jgi:hypothetical protein
MRGLVAEQTPAPNGGAGINGQHGQLAPLVNELHAEGLDKTTLTHPRGRR